MRIVALAQKVLGDRIQLVAPHLRAA